MKLPNWHKEYPPRYDEEAFQAKKPPRTWWILLILAVGYTILIPITWIDTNNFWRWFLIGMGWGGVCLIAVRIQKRRIAIHRFLRWDFRRWG